MGRELAENSSRSAAFNHEGCADVLQNLALTTQRVEPIKTMGYPSGIDGIPDGYRWVTRWVQNGFKSFKSFRSRERRKTSFLTHSVDCKTRAMATCVRYRGQCSVMSRGTLGARASRRGNPPGVANFQHIWKRKREFPLAVNSPART